jgi:hypothetical protein
MSFTVTLLVTFASVQVTRDRLMLELDAQYPQYGFAQHKGYGVSARIGTGAILCKSWQLMSAASVSASSLEVRQERQQSAVWLGSRRFTRTPQTRIDHQVGTQQTRVMQHG